MIDLMQFLRDFGPAMLSGIGAVLAALFSLALWIARAAWRLHTARLEALAEAVKTLAKGMETVDASGKEGDRKLWESVQGVRAELGLGQRSFDHLKTGILKLEGAVESQQRTISLHIASLARMDSKLEALFRFIDAAPRASDVNSGG